MRQLSARRAQLVKMCRRRGCSREDANELVQESYLRLFEYQRRAKVRNADYLLRRIVINLSITFFQRELPKRLALEGIDKVDRQGMLIDPAPGPERTLAAKQQLANVVSLLNALSERTCQIFIAQRGGYSYEEIADAYGVMPRTVEKHVATAISALREMMPADFAAATAPDYR